MQEHRSENLRVSTTPSIKKALRYLAAEHDCTPSTYVHRLLVREIGGNGDSAGHPPQDNAQQDGARS